MDIEYLADHKALIPTLARWFYDEWAYLHPGRSYADVERLIAERAQTNTIPLALVALDGEVQLGTVALKTHDMDTRLDLTPWLAGLYVAAPRRRQGIGSTLVSAIENAACELGVSTLYLYTPEAEAFYVKRGYRVSERTTYHEHQVVILEKHIAAG